MINSKFVDPDIDVASFTETAATWAMEAAELEEKAYEPVAEKLARRQENAIERQNREEMRLEAEADARSTLEAARQALLGS